METEFNWYTELDKAILNEPNEAEWDDLNDMSGDWVTCACGQLCNSLPRAKGGRPEDSELCELGINFAKSVHKKDWKLAYKDLDRIEARTAFLLAENSSLLPE